MQRAAGEVGFDFEIWNNQGGMDAWTQGMAQAIAQDYDLVDLSAGLDPAILIPQIAEAKSDGMMVTTTHLYDETQTEFSEIDASAKIPYTRAGEIMAAWAYVKSGGEANVLIIGSDDVVPTSAFVKSIQDTLAELCPDCGQQYLNVPLAEWGTKIQSGVQSAVLADPSINYILPIYDSMSQFVIPGLRIAGAADTPIVSFNGTPFVLDLVREGAVEMIVGEGLGWAGYASVDVQMRLLCGLPVPETLNIPLVIFDETNIDTVSDPATFDSGYGDAHLAGFRGLWGLE
ncbi:MAG: substrate-binding domain-containing protein, partial [Pseudomonadota bacterium]